PPAWQLAAERAADAAAAAARAAVGLEGGRQPPLSASFEVGQPSHAGRGRRKPPSRGKSSPSLGSIAPPSSLQDPKGPGEVVGPSLPRGEGVRPSPPRGEGMGPSLRRGEEEEDTPPLSEEQLCALCSEWQTAEIHKERGNRRYAIKSYEEALKCYRSAVSEMCRHPFRGTDRPGAATVASKVSSYHANSAAVLMHLGKLEEALGVCMQALGEDPKLGKSLLRMAHILLMLGDAGGARKYYAEAASVGSKREAEEGLRSCVEEEGEQARLREELGSCRRVASTASHSVSAHAQLKALLSKIDRGVAAAPRNVPFKALRTEVLSAMGRGAEARAVCERELKAAESCKLGGLDGLASQSVLWLHSLGRVLYDMCNLSEAAEKLEEALQRPGTPAATKVRPEHAVSLPATAHKPPIDETFLPNEPPLLRMVQRLESERSAGNHSFSRGEWSKAVAAYTRALTIDPTHTRFNALLFCNRAAAHSKHGQLQQLWSHAFTEVEEGAGRRS
ncbi:MAG: hypothetical protein SGPRY_013234, partial [Prymnesium sp.]